MENLNIGDIVICINDGHCGITVQGALPPLRKGNEYIVGGIKRENCCGMIYLDVGLSTTHDNIICHCGTKNPSGGVWWVLAIRFVKKQAKSDRMELSNVTSEQLLK